MSRNLRQIIPVLSIFCNILFSEVLQAQLRINEIITANIEANFSTSFNYNDWVELHNYGSTTINLNGYSLSDDPEDPEKYQIWYDIYLYPGQYYIISLDDKNYIHDVYIHTNFSLDVEGEYLGIYNASGSVVDSIYFGKQTRDISYGRLPGDPDTWKYFTAPSPGSANTTPWLSSNKTAGGIIFSVEPGYYQGSVSVDISATGISDRIVYTTNGDYPISSSPTYNGPVYLTENTVLRARCISDSLHPGPVSSATYFINEEIPSLPVVSLSTRDGHFYNWEYGYYCDGANGVTSWCSDVPVNWARDWERPLNFEYFTRDGVERMNQLVGSKIQGGCSRANALRSFSLVSREDYGKKGLDYSFFSTKDLGSYKSLVLRNSGSDVVASMLRDGFMQTLLIGRMDIDYQAYQPVLVYLNGDFFALMNLREKMNEHWVASNYGLDADEIDVIENTFVMNGDDSAFQAMLNYARTHDLSDPVQMEGMESLLDVNHLMDYYIANIFYENEDWPQNNVKWWRERKPGARFRIMMYDTDMGFDLYRRSGNTLTWALRPHESTDVFVGLMQNESFKNEFIQRFAAHMNTTFAPGRTLPVLDSLKQMIQPYIQRNIDMYEVPYALIGWDWHVNHVMIDFANTQADSVRIWITNYFGLEGSYNLTVSADNPAQGWVEVSGVKVDPDYCGPHFMNIPVRLEAHPRPGYTFIGWTGDINSSDPEISFTRSADTRVEALFACAEPVTGIFINEFVASNESGLQDDYEELEDWIELRNTTDSPINLAGLYISDSAGYPGKYQIPYGESSLTTIPAKGYLLLWADNDCSQGALHLPFKLKKSGETLTLSQTVADHLEIIDSLSYPDQYSDCSYGRDPENTGLWKYLIPTPLCRNEERSVENLYINEVLSSNTGTLHDNHQEYDDWIEVYNANEYPVNIGGLFLTDSPTNTGAYRIPTNCPDSTLIPAGDYLILWADDSTEQGILHLNFKLSSEGEFVGLLQADGCSWLDSLSYSGQFKNISFGRTDDGAEDMSNMIPTPDASNVRVDYRGIILNELLTSEQEVYTDENREHDDWIELHNPQEYPIDVAGMFITDSLADPTKFQIPYQPGDSLIIPANGYLILWADKQPEQGVLHLDFKLKENGEQVGIFDLDGTAIDEISYSNQYNNFSYSRITGTKWLIQPPTFGAANTVPAISKLYINEYMSDNQNRFTDEKGEYEDWIEIYNNNDFEVNLAGLYLTDSFNFPNQYRIPSTDLEATAMPAKSFKIIWTDSDSEQGPLHTNFKLSRQADNIILSEYDYSVTISKHSWTKQPRNFATGRLNETNTWLDMPPTPGESNTLPNISGLLINEIMASNGHTVADNFGDYDDWIELYNSGDTEIDVGGLFISDDLQDEDPYRISSEFPDSTVLLPRQYLLIWADDSTDQGVLHMNFKLSKSGESAAIFGFDKTGLIDTVTYQEVPTDNTWGRIQDGNMLWNRLSLPTPLASNLVTALEEETSFNTPGFSYKVFPNPALSHCVFRVNSNETTELEIRIFSLTGGLVATIFKAPVSQGEQEITWDLTSRSGKQLPKGMYFYTIEADNIYIREKLIIGER
ncbi:MAG: lamin tail domain-containing protein [Bacteroidales bacterium]|nr:lamin tail domain-containing protein [Bacteroidales bacterium]